MTRLRTSMIALICFSISAVAGQAQPPAKKPHDVVELQERYEREIKNLRLIVKKLDLEQKDLADELESARAVAASLSKQITNERMRSAPIPHDPSNRIAALRARLARIDGELNSLAQHKSESPKDFSEQHVQLQKAFTQEHERVTAALAVAMLDAADSTTREDNLTVMRLLQMPVETKGLIEKVKLKMALEYFSDKFGGKLVILVDKAAFMPDQTVEKDDPYEEEVILPPIPSKMRMDTALRLLLSQVGKGEATFVIRQGYVEITTLKNTTAHGYLDRPSTTASFDRRPLQEVLAHLADATGFAIHLDPDIGKNAQTAITARFRNATLEEALTIVSEMAQLKFVVLERSVYVTTPDRAVILRKEEMERASKRKQVKPMPKKLEAAS